MAHVCRSNTMAHKMERFRSQSENSAKPEPHVDNRQRNCLSRSISSPGARHKSSGSESSTTSDIIGASGGRLSILDGDYNNRKISTGSNSEYKFDTKDDSKYKGMQLFVLCTTNITIVLYVSDNNYFRFPDTFVLVFF